MEKIPSFPNVHHLNFEKNLTSSSKRKKTCFKLTSLTLIHNGKDCFEMETKKKEKTYINLTSLTLIHNGKDCFEMD